MKASNWLLLYRKVAATLCFIILFSIYNPVAYATSEVDSFGMDYRTINRLLREADKETDNLKAQQKVDEAKQLFINITTQSPYSDEQIKKDILDHFSGTNFAYIEKKILHLAYLGVKNALVAKDIKQAKQWYEIRESKIKFNREASLGLKTFVQLEQTPDKITELAPLIVHELKDIYMFKLKETLNENHSPSEAYLYYQIVKEDLNEELDSEASKLLNTLLTTAYQEQIPLKLEDQAVVNENISEYFANQITLEEIQDQAKKMIQLLDYIDRNWTVAIKDGQIFNGVEFAELKAFIKEAKQRFMQIHEGWPKDSEKVKTDLEQVEQYLLAMESAETANPLIQDLIKQLATTAKIEMKNEASTSVADPQEVIDNTIALLDEAFNKYKTGEQKEANDQVFEAYFIFEPLETKIAVKDAGAVQAIEQSFAQLRAEIESGKPIEQIETLFSNLKSELTNALLTVSAETTSWGLFVQSFLIIVREGFEAIIIIGALVAYMIKTGQPRQVRYIYYGTLAALGASVVSAYLIRSVFHLSGAHQEALEGITMLIAVTVLFYVSYWMISKVQGQKWQQFIQKKLQDSVTKGNLYTMGLVSFLAVYREGFETILFYQALLTIGDSSNMILYGFLIGCLVLLVLYFAISRFSLKISIKPFFVITSAILYLMAFSFAGHGIFELQEGRFVATTYLTGWPTISLLGVFPTVETLLAQSVLVAALLFAIIHFAYQSIRRHGKITKGA